ncbi:MAG: sigma-54 dependent transcriptional regulator [Thermodesulfobacteriota bacterium]
MASILVVDDELSMREFLTILLAKEGHQVHAAATGAEALSILAQEPVDCLFSDIRMPGMGGLELLHEAKAARPELPVIMITAYASPQDAVTAMKEGAFDYVTKPFKVDEIKAILAAALETAKNVAVASSPGPDTGSFEGIVGTSPEMRRIFEVIRRIAPTRANVLITGESGTGKELVARAIHRLASVEERPFVPITCSAIPEPLLESELFGHVKGAFTGATSGKVGLFELASHGTVFLDEIGELPPMLQVKLLRVLQEREVKRVGGTETVKVDLRIVAATNRDLEEEVMAGRFREDLFYRLAVVPLRVPPLRERKGDVPLLVAHFLREHAARMGKAASGISSYALQVLLDYDFPGNVRELENIIERGLALESSTIILPESLTLSLHKKRLRQHAEEDAPPAAPPAGIDQSDVFALGLDEVVARTEKRLIELGLARAGGSKMRAAELLKVSFRSLRYKIHKYGIPS